MNSELLKWVANGLIAVVLTSTLWMAHAIQPEQGGSPGLLLAQVAPAPAAAASVPAATATR
ncbi:MAG: hypothetical protein ACT6S0_19825 [Roseateles sp.]|uniref:hypothetical protein n=1 Tax=Roseateles sp. TaxID=1971397 RepID=UPI004036C7E1